MKKIVSVVLAVLTAFSFVLYKSLPVDAAAPSAVTTLAAGSGDTSAFLSWTAPANGGSAITDYVIGYRTIGAGSWTTFSDGTSTVTTTTVTGLTNGTRYEFNVQAVNGDGTATDSNNPTTIPLKKIITDDFESYVTSTDVSGQNGWLPGDTAASVLWKVYSRSGSKVVAPDTGTSSADFTKFAIHQSAGQNAHIGFDFSGFTESGRFFPQVWFGRSTGSGNDQGYDTFLWPGSGGDQLIVWKHAAGDGGAGPTVADESFTMTNGTIYRVEAEIITNASNQPVITIWIYPKSGSRGAPALTYTDTSGSPFTGSYLGLGFATLESFPPATDVWYDNIDIYGTEAGPAAAPVISSTSTASGQVTVNWSAPFYTGTSAITDYNIQYKLTSDSSWTTFSDGTSTTTNAAVTGLTNALSYDFRVRAVNSAGAGSYSPLAQATPAVGATAPTASSVAFTGYPAVGKTLTGSYTYSDANGDSEGTSTFRWLRASSSGGSYSAIGGATSSTYVVQAADENQFLKFEVTPVATVAPATGSAALSSASNKVFSEAAYYHILSTGQSLAVGYNSTTALTTTQPYNNLMLTNGVEATSTPLIALRESGNGENGNVETPSSAMANTIRALDVFGRPFIVGLHGHGGAPYNDIKKGTSYYSRGMTQATNSASYVTGTLGGVYYPRAVTLTHGETDYDNGVSAATYQGYLEEMQNDYETDLNTIAGTSGTIPLFINQMNAGLTGTIAVSQLDAHRDNTDSIILVGPKYQMEYASDHVHLTNTGSKYLGELMGKVMEKVLLQGESWNPLMPTAVSRVGAVITASFAIPTGTLAIDTTLVAQRPNYGFEFTQTGGNSPTISSVSLTNNDTEVQVTLSATPTGTNQRLRYAYTCTGNHTGAYDFLCGDADDGTYVGGNIRDTDSTTSSATGSTGLVLYDWLVAFDEPITSDTTAPTVSSITSTTASGTYTPGDMINITVTFSEAVTTTGTVTVNLNSGGSCTITASSSTT
ncbi:MAG TPA: fibronectin type III domain-containing protein, partial [Candidatus Paceibacterota bacterium]|nr:fibronectin type III domain-containing protein [Candidatus Paceibacterota bacterium]